MPPEVAPLLEICQRPPTERPYILFPVGYPAADAEVPDLQRKTLSEVTVEITPESRKTYYDEHPDERRRIEAEASSPDRGHP